jgi:peptidyl-tRNA hydrolase
VHVPFSQQKAAASESFVLSIDVGMVDGVPVLLAKPQTYMNLSGESVNTAFLLKIFSRTGLCDFSVMHFVSLADFTLQ